MSWFSCFDSLSIRLVVSVLQMQYDPTRSKSGGGMKLFSGMISFFREGRRFGESRERIR
jgi:hypothetical protein